jgi:Tfp pilus assembly protein PilN
MSATESETIEQEVNFLPAWYTDAEKRRRALVRSACMAVFLLAGLGVLTVKVYAGRDKAELLRNSASQQLASVQKQVEEVGRLQKAKANLDHQHEIYTELHQAINYSQITGTLAALMPQELALKSLDAHAEKVAVTRAGDGKGGPPQIDTLSMVVIDMEGVSPSDVTVANFIGQLAGSKVFQNVKMIYSRQGRQGPLIVREFSIRMEVPLDCRYVPAKGQEVVDAH